MRKRTTLPFLLLAALLLPGAVVTPVFAADTPPATPTEVQQALESHAPPVEQQRDAVLSFLDRSEVRELAESQGIDTSGLVDVVGTMNADELAPVMQQIGQYESMAGGDRVVITSSALIIILLLLILIAIA